MCLKILAFDWLRKNFGVTCHFKHVTSKKKFLLTSLDFDNFPIPTSIHNASNMNKQSFFFLPRICAKMQMGFDLSKKYYYKNISNLYVGCRIGLHL